MGWQITYSSLLRNAKKKEWTLYYEDGGVAMYIFQNPEELKKLKDELTKAGF